MSTTDLSRDTDSPSLAVLTVLSGLATMVLVTGGVVGIVLAPDLDFTPLQWFWRIAPTVASAAVFVGCVLRGRR
ncbi:hypothetical protein [Labedaea rhizosphaerae]|uniref:Uncharacterized protein n=1 Tax=Labedaea rhizosphaerae TaxID=598644 RepID=A0A4R6S6G2_LABRH|nr:hypothetical protein [Labedaea rhizosphaerae]TDP94904.1 hypothetical protein EV186_105136 [Labedaea rhizosphaerae]